MVDLLQVHWLQPWTFNAGKRLIRSPKVYEQDSGITHALLNIKAFNELLGHPVVGGCWEGFVIENILSVVPEGVQSFYDDTPAGAAIDLILEFSAGEKWAIEINRGASPKLSKGFLIACKDINPDKRFVVYAGKDQFSIGNDVTAALQQNNIATIIGSETGGNLKGTNGGQLFFLRLPNSKIAIDVPLIGYYPLKAQADKGIKPDIEVPLTIADILSDNDKVLDKTMEIIKRN